MRFPHLVYFAFVYFLTTVPIVSEPLTPFSLDWFHVDLVDLWVFGAFWDFRKRDGPFPVFVPGFGIKNFNPSIRANVSMAPPPLVRILMIGDYHESFADKLEMSHCEFSFDQFNSKPIRVKVSWLHAQAINYDVADEKKTRFYAAYCQPLPVDTNALPRAVSLILPDFKNHHSYRDVMGKHRNYLIPIRGAFNNGRGPDIFNTPSNDAKTLVACLKPMNGFPFEELDTLINYLVMYDVLGVQHFIMFDTGTIIPQAYRVLNILRDVGISIEIVPWQLREFGGHELHQNLANEICFHLAIERGFSNAITVDLDEIIVPGSEIDNDPSTVPPLRKLLHKLDALYPKAAMFCFKNVFFPLNCPTRTTEPGLLALRYTARLDTNPNNFRCKCILKPLRIATVDIHDGVPISPEFSSEYLPEEVGKLHHYRGQAAPPMSARERTCSFTNEELRHDSGIGDRFGEKILQSSAYQALRFLIEPQFNISSDNWQLIKTSNDSRVYLFRNGERQPFLTESAFTSRGYNFKDVVQISSETLRSIPIGTDLE